MLPRLIILHGWGQNKQFWAEFASRFPKDQVLILDLPGFSSPLTATYVKDEKIIDVTSWGIPEYADWLKNKIENLKEKNIVLLGHSFGGRIASLAASDNPGWLKGLILYASPCLYRPSFYIRFRIALAKLAKKIGFTKIGKPQELQEAEQNKIAGVFRRAVSFDQTDLLPKIKVPTLIIWGEKDAEVPLKIGQEMNNLIKGSRLVVMDAVGHNAHLENPNLFYGIVKKFIENL